MKRFSALKPLPGFCMAVIVVFSLLVSSCKKTVDEENYGDYLLEYEKVSTLSLVSIQLLLSTLNQQYPDAGAGSLITNTQYGVDVYRIKYETHYGDSLIEASGLVCIPMAGEAFPLISFQNGTTTLNDNVPSLDPYRTEYMLIQSMAGNGYVMVMPDYIGFGASADIVHPYFNKECTDQSVIDIIKAAVELTNIGGITASCSGNYYLMGYSQGGGATLSVLDAIENGPDPGFDVVASSCGAGAYDLASVTEYYISQETIPSPLYLPYFIYAQQVYGTIQDELDKFFNEPYASRMPGLFNGTKSIAEINSQLTGVIQDLLSAEVIEDFTDGADFAQLRNVMADNSTYAWNTVSYINLYHGTDDMDVPSSQSSAIYDDFIELGVSPDRVKFFEFEGLTHNTGIIPWGVATILWFNELETK
ncbi:MAG: hypothetical protein JXB19_00635 [Bacteroidales bacterium]|nr:hypothetical protein [Bacteroidales bacterium]